MAAVAPIQVFTSAEHPPALSVTNAQVFDSCHLLDIPSRQVNAELDVIWSWRLLVCCGQGFSFIQINNQINMGCFLPDQIIHPLQQFTKLSRQDNVIGVFEISKQNWVQFNATNSCLLKPIQQADFLHVFLWSFAKV